MIDRNWPVVAGDIPVELVVTFKIAYAVADDVIDLHCPRRVDRVGNVNFQIAIAAGSRGLILQLLTRAISDGLDIQEQRVVCSLRTGIIDRNGAVNSVPLPDEDEADALFDQRRSIAADRDHILEVGDPPALRPQRNGQSE